MLFCIQIKTKVNNKKAKLLCLVHYAFIINFFKKIFIVLNKPINFLIYKIFNILSQLLNSILHCSYG